MKNNSEFPFIYNTKIILYTILHHYYRNNRNRIERCYKAVEENGYNKI
jgi:hypothetical protein